MKEELEQIVRQLKSWTDKHKQKFVGIKIVDGNGFVDLEAHDSTFVLYMNSDEEVSNG